MTNIIARDAGVGVAAPGERRVRPGPVLAIVLVGQFMAVLDTSIVNVAAPSIHASLRASGAGLAGRYRPSTVTARDRGAVPRVPLRARVNSGCGKE